MDDLSDLSVIPRLNAENYGYKQGRDVCVLFNDYLRKNDESTAESTAKNIVDYYMTECANDATFQENMAKFGMVEIYHFITIAATCTPWKHSRQKLLAKLAISLFDEWNQNHPADVNQDCFVRELQDRQRDTVPTDSDRSSTMFGGCEKMHYHEWVNINAFIARCFAGGGKSFDCCMKPAAVAIGCAFGKTKIKDLEILRPLVIAAAQYILLMGDVLHEKCMANKSPMGLFNKNDWARWIKQFKQHLDRDDNELWYSIELKAAYNKMLSLDGEQSA